MTIREETITTYLERQKEGGRAGDRTDGAVPARPPAGKRPAENPWTKIAAERRRASACAVLALVLALAGLFLRFVPGIAEPFRGVRPGDGPAAFIEYVLPDSTVMRDDLSYLASSADARTVRATRMDGTAVTVPFGKFVAWRYRDTDLSGRDDLRTVLVGMPDGTMLELRGIVTATRPVFGTDWPLLDPPVLRIRTADTDWYVAPENAVVTDGR